MSPSDPSPEDHDPDRPRVGSSDDVPKHQQQSFPFDFSQSAPPEIPSFSAADLWQPPPQASTSFVQQPAFGFETAWQPPHTAAAAEQRRTSAPADYGFWSIDPSAVMLSTSAETHDDHPHFDANQFQRVSLPFPLNMSFASASAGQGTCCIDNNGYPYARPNDLCAPLSDKTPTALSSFFYPTFASTSQAQPDIGAGPTTVESHPSVPRRKPSPSNKTTRRFDPRRSSHSSASSAASSADSDGYHSEDSSRASNTSRKSAIRKRQARNIVQDSGLQHLRNSDHIFVVHVQTKTVPEVCESAIIEVRLVPNTPLHLPLARAAYGIDNLNADVSEQEDIRIGNEYVFVELNGNRLWSLSFGSGEAAIRPLPPSTTSAPEDQRHVETPDAIYTFIHFAPYSIIVSDDCPLGSRQWWRIQECDANHGSRFPNGIWSARFDDPKSGEPRRPARIVGHFATCKHHAKEGDSYALGKLARAVKRPIVVPPASSRASASASGGGIGGAAAGLLSPSSAARLTGRNGTIRRASRSASE